MAKSMPNELPWSRYGSARTDPLLFQLQSLRQGDLTSCQNSVQSHP